MKIILLVFLSLPLAFAQENIPSISHSIRQLDQINSSPIICSESTNRKIEKGSVILPSGRSTEVSILDYEYLQAVFKYLASRPDIPFEYPEDGCQARAYKMGQLMEAEGIVSAKLFVSDPENVFHFKTNKSPKGYVEWNSHVVSVVIAKKDNKEQVYVIDPSMFNQPVTVEHFIEVIKKHGKNKKFNQFYTNRFNYICFNPDDCRENTEYNDALTETAEEALKKYLPIHLKRINKKKPKS